MWNVSKIKHQLTTDHDWNREPEYHSSEARIEHMNERPYRFNTRSSSHIVVVFGKIEYFLNLSTTTLLFLITEEVSNTSLFSLLHVQFRFFFCSFDFTLLKFLFAFSHCLYYRIIRW